MSEGNSLLSRRGFLGGSLAAAGGLALGPLGSRAEAQEAVPALPLGDLAPALGAQRQPSAKRQIANGDLAPSGSLDEAYWWRVRSQFNIIDGLVFMNNGSLGPVPRVVQEENERLFRELAEDPTRGNRRDELHENRGPLAEFVGASKEEIAYTRSTTEGMNILAQGLDWREGDEVLMCLHEHNGGIGAYKTLEKRRGIKIKWLDIPSPPESADQVVSLY